MEKPFISRISLRFLFSYVSWQWMINLKHCWTRNSLSYRPLCVLIFQVSFGVFSVILYQNFIAVQRLVLSLVISGYCHPLLGLLNTPEFLSAWLHATPSPSHFIWPQQGPQWLSTFQTLWFLSKFSYSITGRCNCDFFSNTYMRVNHRVTKLFFSPLGCQMEL